MEAEDKIIVKRVQEDVETSNNLLNKKFLNLALYGNEWFDSRSGLFIPWNKRSWYQMNRTLN